MSNIPEKAAAGEGAASTRLNGLSSRPGDAPAATVERATRQARGHYMPSELARLAKPKALLDLGGGCYVPPGFTVIYGPPKVGKTTLAVNWACLRRGAELDAEQTRTCYYSTEGNKADFYEMLLAAWHLDPKYLDYVFEARFVPVDLTQTKAHKVPDPSDPWNETSVWEDCDTEKLISDRDEGINAQLLVIDTLSNCFGGKDENSSGPMSAFCQNIRRIIREGAARNVWVLHHSLKNSNVVRGHSALAGDVDCMLRLAPAKDGFKVTCDLMRGGPKWPCAVHYRRDGARIERVEAPARAEPKETAAKAPSEPASSDLDAKVAKALPLDWKALQEATGAPKSSLSRSLKRLGAVKGADGRWFPHGCGSGSGSTPQS